MVWGPRYTLAMNSKNCLFPRVALGFVTYVVGYSFNGVFHLSGRHVGFLCCPLFFITRQCSVEEAEAGPNFEVPLALDLQGMGKKPQKDNREEKSSPTSPTTFELFVGHMTLFLFLLLLESNFLSDLESNLFL